MPFYEYECSTCQHHTEVLQKISDAPLRKCPACGKQALKRLISAPVFRLKGGGWYETDFKSEGEQKRNLAGTEAAEDKTETKSEDAKSTEAKPAEKTDAKPAESKPAEKKVASAGSKSVAKAAPKPAAKPVAKAKPTKSVAKKKSARR